MKIIRSIRIPDNVRSGEPVKAADHNAILEALRNLAGKVHDMVIRPSADIGIKPDGSPGQVLFLKHKTATGTTETTICPFGEITNWTELGATEEDPPVAKKGVRGGVCYCGDKNFNVPPYAVNPEVDGEWLCYLWVECESNRDDDNEIILPGIKTSAATAPDAFWRKDAADAETQYPDNENPEVSDGLGTICVPIGRLKVESGSITIAKVDCGNITINQCGGVLAHTRG